MTSWNNVSASQVQAFSRCQRYWHYGWIQRLPRPSTPAQKRGIDIHSELEYFLKYGTIRLSQYRDHVIASKPYLPQPGDSLVVEKYVAIDCGQGLPSWIGYIDLLYRDETGLVVHDHKTISDFRYAKKPEDLVNDTQMNAYAYAALQLEHASDTVTLAHMYVRTRDPLAVRLVKTAVSANHVRERWRTHLLPKVRDMCVAQHLAIDELPPPISDKECLAYGGCPYRNVCTYPRQRQRTFFSTLQGKTMGDFLARIRATGSILPPDAPSRESGPVKISNPANDDLVNDAVPKVAIQEMPSRHTVPGDSSFSLYIGCSPVGRQSDASLFEDWWATIVESMNQEVQARGIEDYRLLSYSDEKLLIAQTVQASEVPPSMVVANANTVSAKDALQHLVPRATLVVRAFSG
jgi:hypothetical protein